MNTAQALEIFGYSSVNELDKEEHKIRYRKLMRIYHPDIYNHQSENVDIPRIEAVAKTINEANVFIEKLIPKIEEMRSLELQSKKGSELIILPFQAIFDIYNGKTMTVQKSSGNVEITKASIRQHKVYFNVECEVQYNNINTIEYWVLARSPKDEYNIDLAIPVLSLQDEPAVRLNLYGKTPVVNLRGLGAELRLSYDYGVILTVSIKKKLMEIRDGN